MNLTYDIAKRNITVIVEGVGTFRVEGDVQLTEEGRETSLVFSLCRPSPPEYFLSVKGRVMKMPSLKRELL